MSALKDFLLPVVDMMLVPFVYPAATLLRKIRQVGVRKLPLCRDVLLGAGVFPIRDHYYEPQFDMRHPRRPFGDERPLPGVDWNLKYQLHLLESLTYADELQGVPRQKTDPLRFHFGNGSFEEGDAEYWYQIIRHFKPRRIIEVGSGFSTLMAIAAVEMNTNTDPGYECDHICIEPFEMPWLDKCKVTTVRKKIEDIEVSFFQSLEANDVLFIDSSHVVRPDGDVLYEYLELLPTLRPGVIVHVHDVFSPRNYPKNWMVEDVLFWNEQYILEAFLTNNSHWSVISALNLLHHNHYDSLVKVCPYLTKQKNPGSFYMRKRG